MTGMGRPKAGPAFPHDEIPHPKTREELRDENDRLRAALTKIADPLALQVEGIGTERALRIITTMQTIAKDAIDHTPCDSDGAA